MAGAAVVDGSNVGAPVRKTGRGSQGWADGQMVALTTIIVVVVTRTDKALRLTGTIPDLPARAPGGTLCGVESRASSQRQVHHSHSHPKHMRERCTWHRSSSRLTTLPGSPVGTPLLSVFSKTQNLKWTREIDEPQSVLS